MVDFVKGIFGSSSADVRPHAPGFLEGVVSDVLQPLLGSFVRGIDRDHLTMSIWDGEVLLHDLELRTEVIDALPGVPFRVLGGTIGKVRVSVPWRNLGGESMMVSIDRVLLLLVARSGDPTEEHGEKAKAEGKRALAEAVEEQNAAGEKMGQTLVDRLVAALVRKVQLSISNVHVRIQGSPVSVGFAGGAMVRSIRIDTPPQEAREGRTDARARSRLEEELSRKRLTVEGLMIYLDTTAAFGSVIESDNQPSGSPSGARAMLSRMLTPPSRAQLPSGQALLPMLRALLPMLQALLPAVPPMLPAAAACLVGKPACWP